MFLQIYDRVLNYSSQNGSYWTGARDVGNNNFVWVGTDEVLPLSSSLWWDYASNNIGRGDCVAMYKPGAIPSSRKRRRLPHDPSETNRESDVGKLYVEDCARELNIICHAV